MRGYLARRNYKIMKTAAIVIQKHWRGYNNRMRYRTLKRGIIKAQALQRGRVERKRYTIRKAEQKRRLEAEQIAKERAKQRAAKESQRMVQQQLYQQQQQLQQQQQQHFQHQRTAVHHLEIPAELAFIFSKLEGYTPPHTERNLVKVLGGVTGNVPPISLPHDFNQFEFSKFTSVYFKGTELGLRRDPISQPFLSKAAARDQDFQDAVAVFKLILRWCNDNQLAGPKERALADYIVHKGLNSRNLRDELLVQLVNQTWRNDNSEKIWQLMSHCLSCFQPSPALNKYVRLISSPSFLHYLFYVVQVSTKVHKRPCCSKLSGSSSA